VNVGKGLAPLVADLEEVGGPLVDGFLKLFNGNKKNKKTVEEYGTEEYE
jgi:hypothetical protein